MDTISVIVPVYNCAAQLGRCLDSLLAQTVPVEIVAVDDGSTDGSLSVLERYAQRFPDRLRFLRQENRGVTAARLAGVRAATGMWIGFVDGDDTVEPRMYQFLLENAQAAGADIAHCGHQIHYADGRVDYIHNSGIKFTQDRLQGLRDLLRGGQIDGSLCTKLYRRSLFDGVEGWMDTAIKNGEDLLMNYYLFSRAGLSVYEDRCPYRYLLREGSASHHQFNEHVLFDPVRVRARILEDCQEPLKDDARQALLRYLLFVYAQAALKPRAVSQPYRDRAREMLRQRKADIPLLSRRNQILARMILTAPWSFQIAYRLYLLLFQRQEEH